MCIRDSLLSTCITMPLPKLNTSLETKPGKLGSSSAKIEKLIKNDSKKYLCIVTPYSDEYIIWHCSTVSSTISSTYCCASSHREPHDAPARYSSIILPASAPLSWIVLK